MTKGWSILEPLESASPAEALGQAVVDRVCDDLAQLSTDLRKRVEAALRKREFHKWADGIRNEYVRSDERLFNAYFSNKAYSFAVPSNPPERLDGCRMSIAFHMSDDLLSKLLAHLRGVPTADVMNAKSSRDPEAFRSAYRYTNLRAIITAIKSVQYDVEDFAFGAEGLLVGFQGSGGSFRSSSWRFDADMMDEQVLLGFLRSPTPSLLNSNYVSSPVVAAGLVRSHLEAVLVRADFHSSLAGHQELAVDAWSEALKQHRDGGRVSQSLSHWVTEIYGLLSMALHSGSALSRGEIWTFGRIVELLRNELQTAGAATAP